MKVEGIMNLEQLFQPRMQAKTEQSLWWIFWAHCLKVIEWFSNNRKPFWESKRQHFDSLFFDENTKFFCHLLWPRWQNLLVRTVPSLFWDKLKDPESLLAVSWKSAVTPASLLLSLLLHQEWATGDLARNPKHVRRLLSNFWEWF